MKKILKKEKNRMDKGFNEESNYYSPVVTKEELIDILYQKSLGNKLKLFKEEISNIIDTIVEYETQKNRIYEFRELAGLFNIDTTLDFINTCFFKIDNNKYIYLDYNSKNPNQDKDYIKQIDYILDNKLHGGKYDDALKALKNEYVRFFNDLEENDKEKFKEYDYIKVICDNYKYYNIDIKDIKKCLWHLHYNNQENYLTIDEQIYLRLIILFGIRNIYLNASDYHKENESETINLVIRNIEEYILFIKQNKDKIKNENKASLNSDYIFNLFEFLNSDYKKKLGLQISFYDKLEKNNFNMLIELLRYISFDYYVSNNMFEEATKIYEMNLPLFKVFREFKGEGKYLLVELLTDILKVESTNCTKYLSYDNFQQLEIPSKIKRNIKIILKFYISCYYYFKHFNDDKNANKVYEYLLYFKCGYNIEDFFVKYNYSKIAEEICSLKIDDINDTRKADEAFQLMHKKIEKIELVNKFEIEDVVKRYPYINFNNLHEDVKTCIASGDKIFLSNNNIQGFDFSCVVVEWCKAVEFEIDNKLFSKIVGYKSDIERYSNNCFKFPKECTIGTFKAIEDYNLKNHLYSEYFSKLYKLNKDTYNELFKFLIDLTPIRNDAAHKGKIINIITADKCRDKVLKANKILEILSKLEAK